MRKNETHLSRHFWFLLVMLGLFCATALAAIVFRIRGPLAHQPIIVDALSPAPSAAGEGINLNDTRVIEQTFIARAPIVSHVAIGAANFRGASDVATLIVSLENTAGQKLGEAAASLAALKADDVTVLPLPLTLIVGEEYRLRLWTQGVAGGQDLTIFYEKDAQAFPEGSARLTSSGDEEISSLTGNVRFQIRQHPGLRVLALYLLRSVSAWVVVGLAAITCGVFLRWRKGIGAYLARKQSLSRLAWSEIFFVTVLGGMLALTVTLPYFTQLSQITTMGDVHRALVYRGVAREAVLAGEGIAQWDPYLCGGEPLLANAESAQLDPFFALTLLFGENLGARLSVLATLIIGFMGMYVLARQEIGLGRLPALLAAGIFPFSGFQMLAFANGNFAWIPVGWIPWFVWALLRARKNFWYVVPASIVLAFIFFGGSAHMVVYAVLAGGFVTAWLAILTRSWRPLLMWVLAGMLFVPLVAVKLLPLLEIQAVSGVFNRPPPFIPPWEWVGKMFWDREQLATPQWKYEVTGENFRWIEYGTYVGIVPVGLFLIGLVETRRRKLWLALALAALLLFPMIYGWFPWTVLQKLPFLDGVLRNPQRARVVFLLMGGIIAGIGLTRLMALVSGRRKKWGQVIAAGLVVFVLIDLVTFHQSLYTNLFNLPAVEVQDTGQFTRVTSSYTNEEQGYYKVGYQNYLSGQGTVDLCMPYQMGRGVHARGIDSSNPEKPYMGEAWLSERGEVRPVVVKGDTTHVAFAAEEDGWLTLNQHYFPGWRTSPAREISNRGGMVAARVTSADQEIIFRYLPRSFQVGLALSAMSWVGLLWLRGRRDL